MSTATSIGPRVRRIGRTREESRRRVLSWKSRIFLTLLGLAMFVAPPLIPHDAHQQSLPDVLLPPSAAHWLGTDHAGRDVLARLVLGIRTSMLAAFVVVSVALVIGLAIGLVSGYFAKRVDRVIMALNDAVISVPGLLMVMAIVAIAGQSLRSVVIGLIVVITPSLVRLARAEALAVRESTFVEAARSIGVSDFVIIRSHILRLVLPPLVVQTTILIGISLIAEGGLSFLGLGAQSPTISLGSMIQEAFRQLNRAPWLIFVPGLTTTLIVLGSQFVGEDLRRAVTAQDPVQDHTEARGAVL